PGDINRSFLAGTFDWESFNEPIAFESGTTDEEEVIDEVAEDEGGDDASLDKLLWWCSAKGEGSYASFKEACKTLGLGEQGDSSPWQYARKLLLLGHIEVAGSGPKFGWGITPPALVVTYHGSAYLSG